MSQLTIAMIHYTAPPVVGGVEAVLQAHAKFFHEAGYKVKVIAGRGDQKLLSDGVKLIKIPELDSRHPHIAALSSSLDEGEIPEGFDAAVAALVEKLQPVLSGVDRVIVHNIFTKHFNLPLTAALDHLVSGGQQGVIAWCHDFSWTSPHSSKNVYPRYPWDLLSRYNPGITYVTVSKARQVELATLLQVPLDTIKVIYNGVDEAEILGLSGQGLELIHRLGLLDVDLVLLMPVRVTEAKNIEFALEVTAALKAQGVALRLVLTGPPDPHDERIMDYYHRLLDLRQRLDVVNEMRFVYESGAQDKGLEISQNIVAQLLRVSDAVLMPSKREGFGMPILEAGLMGIPVFCSRFPAAEEVGIKDVYFIEDGETPQETAHRILLWLESDPIHHLREVVRQEFTWRQIFKRDILPLL